MDLVYLMRSLHIFGEPLEVVWSGYFKEPKEEVVVKAQARPGRAIKETIN